MLNELFYFGLEPTYQGSGVFDGPDSLAAARSHRGFQSQGFCRSLLPSFISEGTAAGHASLQRFQCCAGLRGVDPIDPVIGRFNRGVKDCHAPIGKSHSARGLSAAILRWH